MMRALFVLGGMFLASAHDSAKCAVEGGDAVGPLGESIMNIWAATQRCEKGGSSMACEIDITAAISSVDTMISIIVKSLKHCGYLHMEHPKCGMAVNHLIADSAGLASEVGTALGACPWPVPATTLAVPAKLERKTSLGYCVVDATNSVKTLFAAVHTMSTMHADCEKAGGKCDHNALKLVEVLSQLGSFVAGAVAHCKAAAGGSDTKAVCASTVQGMVNNLVNVADVGMSVHKACALTDEQRLYLEADSQTATSTSSSLPMALAALLPISAVLSFVAGSRFAKARAQSVRSPDCEMLVEE